MLWLQDHLARRFSKTLLCVSHDASFLNSTVTNIVELAERRLEYHGHGNVDRFLRARRKREAPVLLQCGVIVGVGVTSPSPRALETPHFAYAHQTLVLALPSDLQTKRCLYLVGAVSCEKCKNVNAKIDGPKYVFKKF